MIDKCIGVEMIRNQLYIFMKWIMIMEWLMNIFLGNRLNELYFDNLYWINWKDIYKHTILYLSNPDSVIVDKQKYVQ